jgi:hypothetical protein
MPRNPAADSRSVMTRSDLDQLTTLLGKCLGRIDEQAYRLQQLGDDDCAAEDAGDVLEHEAATLQELVGSLMEQVVPDHADLNDVVRHTAAAWHHELQLPIVMRQRLAPKLPPVACNPGQLTYAVQRALVLAGDQLQAGDELVLTSRIDADQVLLEIEGRGTPADRRIDRRVQTLCDFVASFRGHCRVARDERHQLLIVFELPLALVPDDR